jgi:hypothetical protein
MMEYRESPISAHHNYLVNGMLTQGFAVGDPSSNDRFFLLADIVPHGETGPRISARLMDEDAHLLLELKVNRIDRNPGKCTIEPFLGGYRIRRSSGDVLIEVRTRAFANGYLTLIEARLLDERGRVRVEPRDEGIGVCGGECRFLEAPLPEGGSTKRE